MKDYVPQRILLKDFQGDMRLVDEDFPQAQSLPEQVKAVTARLSADYIIPKAFDKRVGPAVAEAVAKAARETGAARI